jgi:hypothetical protein
MSSPVATTETLSLALTTTAASLTTATYTTGSMSFTFATGTWTYLTAAATPSAVGNNGLPPFPKSDSVSLYSFSECFMITLLLLCFI